MKKFISPSSFMRELNKEWFEGLVLPKLKPTLRVHNLCKTFVQEICTNKCDARIDCIVQEAKRSIPEELSPYFHCLYYEQHKGKKYIRMMCDVSRIDNETVSDFLMALVLYIERHE